MIYCVEDDASIRELVLYTMRASGFEARGFAEMGILPAGMYRNRAFAEAAVDAGEVPLAVQDMLYDPQTSGGLLIAVHPDDADALYADLRTAVPSAQRIGTVRHYRGGKYIFLR